MPWIEAMLRGQRVLARAKPDGAFEVESGRVEIRYKPKDGKSYRAAAGNLALAPGAKLLPDDACAAAEPAAPKKKDPEARKERFDREHVEAADGAWVAWTDGACTGNPGPAGAGFLVIAPDKSKREGYEYLGIATNNVGELTAILRAVEAMPAGASAVVYTDSKYAIGVLTKSWKAKVNQELIAKTKDALRGRHVDLRYVPGHSGIADNERADELARTAIVTRASRKLAHHA
jgi:ribonuclease HI